LAQHVSPAAAREVLEPETRRVERVLLEIRLRDGLPVSALDQTGRGAVATLGARGLVELAAERLVLTRQGRLLADAVVRDLLP
jgi:oxygen-independent coproporphyrinogen-3 oxidase